MVAPGVGTRRVQAEAALPTTNDMFNRLLAGQGKIMEAAEANKQMIEELQVRASATRIPTVSRLTCRRQPTSPLPHRRRRHIAAPHRINAEADRASPFDLQEKQTATTDAVGVLQSDNLSSPFLPVPALPHAARD